MMRAILTLLLSLLATSAFAEDAKPAAPEEQSQSPAPAPAPEAKPQAAAPAEKPKPSAHATTPSKPKQVAAAPAMSQSKFLGALYSEIARHTPKDNKAGPGVVAASFRVNASGKIENVSIKNSTSAAHAEVVKKILASVKAPPPPTGSFDVSQNFKFH